MCSKDGKNIENKAEPWSGGGCYPGGFGLKEDFMRGVLLWLIGVPIPIIILLYLFNVV